MYRSRPHWLSTAEALLTQKPIPHASKALATNCAPIVIHETVTKARAARPYRRAVVGTRRASPPHPARRICRSPSERGRLKMKLSLPSLAVSLLSLRDNFYRLLRRWTNTIARVAEEFDEKVCGTAHLLLAMPGWEPSETYLKVDICKTQNVVNSLLSRTGT